MNRERLSVTNESLNHHSLQRTKTLSISPTQSQSNTFHLCNTNTYVKVEMPCCSAVTQHNLPSKLLLRLDAQSERGATALDLDGAH